jgi:hypothetical protein
MAAHLAANEVDIAGTKLTFGEFLEMDPKKERFTSDRKANEMLTREYRKPFVVPDKV